MLYLSLVLDVDEAACILVTSSSKITVSMTTILTTTFMTGVVIFQQQQISSWKMSDDNDGRRPRYQRCDYSVVRTR